MLSLFRTNQIAFNLLLIIYILLIRGSALFVTPPIETFEGQGVLSDWIHGIFGTNGTGAVIFGIVLVFIQSLLINIIIAKFRMASSVSLFPGLFYILLASMFPEFLSLSPALLANTFFILAIWELFETYRKNDVSGNIVNVGFWIGLASLFYFSEIVFLLLAVVGLSVLRAFKVKELIMLYIGFLLPYILTVVYFFWNDQLLFFWQNYIAGNFSFFDFKIESSLYSYIKIGIVVLLSLVVFFSINSYYAKKSIQAQKNVTCLLWALAFAAISFIFQTEIQFYHLLVFMVPLGILLSFNFFKMKPPLAEAIHMLFFVAILIWQFNTYWLK